MTTDSRLGNISNILSSAPTRPRLVPELTTTTPQRDDADATATETAPAKHAQQSRPAEPRRTPAKPAANRATVHRVPVRLDADLRELLDLASRARESTLSEVAFDALEEAHQAGQLAALVERDTERATPHSPREPREHGTLFQRPQSRNTAQPTVLTEFRLTGQDLAVLDSLVAETAAESRSQLIKASLRRHLSKE